MSAVKKVLVLGATGAMGKYLIPKLLERNYQVDAVALDEVDYQSPNLRSIKGNALQWDFLLPLLENNYDGIVDFMIYRTADCYMFVPELLKHTAHYIYLSSYRIYDNRQIPVREDSPRLIDSSEDMLLRNSDDYCIFKARGENILTASGKKNWTIVRPAITYSLMRYQLVTLEAYRTVARAVQGKSVVLPAAAREVNATMSWAGDVAEMLARLLFNPSALTEAFTLSTAEHHTWGEIADYYHDICNLNAVWVDTEDYVKLLNFPPYLPNPRWQLIYDRFFDRIIDNSKVLEVCGMHQSSMRKLYDGLKYEISRFKLPPEWQNLKDPMDEYLAGLGK